MQARKLLLFKYLIRGCIIIHKIQSGLWIASLRRLPPYASARNLEEVVLRSHCSTSFSERPLPQHKFVQMLAATVASAKLKSLYPDRFLLRFAELVAFINRHDFLERLELKNCRVHAIGKVQYVKECPFEGAVDIFKSMTVLDSIFVDEYCEEMMDDGGI